HLDLVDVRRVQVGDAVHGVVLIRRVPPGRGGRDRVQVVADRVVADDDAVHDDQGVNRRVDRGDAAQVDLHAAHGGARVRLDQGAGDLPLQRALQRAGRGPVQILEA